MEYQVTNNLGECFGFFFSLEEAKNVKAKIDARDWRQVVSINKIIMDGVNVVFIEKIA